MPITTCSCFDDNELLLTGSLAFEAKSESLALSIISASFRELVFFLLSLQCVVAVPILRFIDSCTKHINAMFSRKSLHPAL